MERILFWHHFPKYCNASVSGLKFRRHVTRAKNIAVSWLHPLNKVKAMSHSPARGFVTHVTRDVSPAKPLLGVERALKRAAFGSFARRSGHCQTASLSWNLLPWMETLGHPTPQSFQNSISNHLQGYGVVLDECWLQEVGCFALEVFNAVPPKWRWRCWNVVEVTPSNFFVARLSCRARTREMYL